METKALAVVTGAASGLGYEIAAYCAQDGLDLLIADQGREIETAADQLRGHGTQVTAIEADLSTTEGVDRLLEAIGGRPIAAVVANAGRGLAQGFLDHDFDAARQVLDTNVTGTVYLVHRVANRMRRQGGGRILITGSIAGYTPKASQSVYKGTKGFLDSFAASLREELEGTGITVTTLMPGTGEEAFEEQVDEAAHASAKKPPPARPNLARAGFDAMMGGYADILTGWKDKGQVARSELSSPKM